MTITTVRKRTGELVTFNAEKITVAIQKAMLALDMKNRKKAESLTKEIVDSLQDKKSSF
ncbi:MAG: ATP cone domain-containing protein [Thermoplasmata archaeon]|nr:ATP cone domain-containing protein [Thermoplasmata archaeon]